MSTTNHPTTAYDFAFETIDGKPLPLASFHGKAILVVNTASECGYTPQYEGLERLWRSHRGEGLVVLGVPCNDFGAQEPGTDSQIEKFCSRDHGVTFPLTRKSVVKGKDAHPFYRWANEQAGVLGQPRWNFHKYLFDRDGRFVTWFSTVTMPDSPKVIAAIQAAM
jgi:glutathione peroxidase